MSPARCSSAVCCVLCDQRSAGSCTTAGNQDHQWDDMARRRWYMRQAGGAMATWMCQPTPTWNPQFQIPEQKTRRVLCVLHFAFCDARWRAWCLPWSCPNGQQQIAGALGAARFLWLTLRLRKWPATPAPPARRACAVVCTPLSSAPHTTKDGKCAVVHPQVVWGVTKAQKTAFTAPKEHTQGHFDLTNTHLEAKKSIIFLFGMFRRAGARSGICPGCVSAKAVDCRCFWSSEVPVARCGNFSLKPGAGFDGDSSV